MFLHHLIEVCLVGSVVGSLKVNQYVRAGMKATSSKKNHRTIVFMLSD